VTIHCFFCNRFGKVSTRAKSIIFSTYDPFIIKTNPKSVWYGAILRGDVNPVTVGEKTSIGDRAVVHVAKIQGDFPNFIGSHVTIGAGALVHAATLQDSCVIGEAAQVLDGSIVESHAIVAPASIVTPGTTVGSGELWSGAPAKKVRALTAEEIAVIPQMASETAALAAVHILENAKEYKQIVMEEKEADDDIYRDPFEPTKQDFDPGDVLGMGHPGRIFRSVLSHPEEYYEQLNKEIEERNAARRAKKKQQKQ
jgi:gamma-carbonic anhydrase